jgi:phosphate-selective porin OprO/OprP
MRLLPVITAVCYFWVSIASAQTLDHDHEIPVQRLQRQNEELLDATHALQQQNQRLLKQLEESSYANFAPATVDESQIRDVVSSLLADERRRQAAVGTALPEDAWFEVGQDLDMTATWRHGVWLESKDKAFRFHAGGRVQHDMIWMHADDAVQFAPGGTGPIRDGVNFRRGRFAMEGAFHDVVEFYTEWDFINTADVDPTNPASQSDAINSPVPTDLWVQLTDIPWIGTVRFGNTKPPLSFEHLTSSRYLNFLERSLAFDAFIGGIDNGFKPGVLIYNATDDDRVTWALGAFKNNTTIFGWNQGDGEWDLTGRVTWTPYYQDNGRHLVHLGLGASFRDLDEGRVRLRARTLLRNGPAAQHTPLLNILLAGDDQVIVVPEFAMNWGPWTLQSEYFAVWVTDTTFPAVGAGAVNRGTAFFQSAYVELLYFLTDEHRPYNRKGGNGAAFKRVIPHSNAYFVADECGNKCSSRGAWQVGVRYSWIDLNDLGINGGSVKDVTVGLNWYINPNLKFQWNYTVSDRDVNGASDGLVHGFGMRTAFDF